ncbi:type VI secretion system-associated FHA domain protein TagH [Noviherbaspirillum aerium]|uniref:type VI secretion system-associated FHA domain protein TagH n=1 Tax=Noviherbaspirillum aerium TaxID=2588497 RepID=UPI00124C87EC|nr:type VI secretion system-associated FHA domain protein TagH [Noviherbaspirillum aerium]
MLVRVMRCKGRTPDIAAEAVFNEAGGTIGRSSQCTLPLPDADRHISRVQAEIGWTGTAFMLTDLGSGNPTLHNGEAIGRGHTVPLADGDELHIGDYVLRVELPAPRGDRTGPFPELGPTARNLLLAQDGGPAAGRNDGVMPHDFDAVGKSRLPPAHSGEGIGALSGPGSPAAPPNTAASFDPSVPLQPAPRHSDTAMLDHPPEIPAPVPLPSVRLEPGKTANAEGDVAFRSWESSDGVASTAINPGRHRETPPRTSQAQAPASPAEPSENRPASSSPFLAALLSGAGLRDAPCDPLSGKRFELDEQTMERLGSLLRLLAQGVIDLLAARSMMKSEMHAPVTFIAAQGNNPLKFSPDASAALAFLLAADTPRGFMAPEAAVEDAMRDLLAHEAGVLDGMRAAMASVLLRFEPQQLETRLGPKSLLGGLLPMNRKARLWEQFEAQYDALARETEDDFESLFSEAFVRAYQERTAALKNRPAAAGSTAGTGTTGTIGTTGTTGTTGNIGNLDNTDNPGER